MTNDEILEEIVDVVEKHSGTTFIGGIAKGTVRQITRHLKGNGYAFRSNVKGYYASIDSMSWKGVLLIIAISLISYPMIRLSWFNYW